MVVFKGSKSREQGQCSKVALVLMDLGGFRQCCGVLKEGCLESVIVVFWKQNCYPVRTIEGYDFWVCFLKLSSPLFFDFFLSSCR